MYVSDRSTKVANGMWFPFVDYGQVAILRRSFVDTGKLRGLALTLVAGLVGGVVGHLTAPEASVHAQDHFSGVNSCITVVPKSWGAYKGGSEYGLAFEDETGVIRFVLHPSCGSGSSPGMSETSAIDLEIQRR